MRMTKDVEHTHLLKSPESKLKILVSTMVILGSGSREREQELTAGSGVELYPYLIL